MKTDKEKKAIKKFDLEKMNVAKLKNIHLINGGYGVNLDDPIEGTGNGGANGSSQRCHNYKQ
jgi:hypothetical protein